MVAVNARTIRFEASCLTYRDACLIARRAGRGATGRCVHLHLDATVQTSTAALARLVLLRRELLRRGRDLRIVGLRGRARALYDISRLDRLLPLLPAGHA